MNVFDTHIHSDLLPESSLSGARGRYRALVPSVTPQATELWLSGDPPSHLLAAAALHPWQLRHDTSQDFERVRALVAHPRVVAIGETGLDHYRHKTQPDRDAAAALFDAHLGLARETELPLVVHCVRAHGACIDALRSRRPARGGVIHAFSGSAEVAADYDRLGFCVGIGPAVTRHRSTRVRAAAAAVPDHQLLIETDAPFMRPASRPDGDGVARDILEVVAEVAELRRTSPEHIADLTWTNACRVFGLTP